MRVGFLHCVLCFICLQRLGSCQSDAEVRVLSEAPGFQRALTDEDLSVLYRENLEADFAPHEAQGPLGLSDLLALLDSVVNGRKPARFLLVFVIKDNAISYVPFVRRPLPLATSRGQAMLLGLQNATRLGMHFPNTLLVMNTWDEARCRRRAPLCAVPVFALIKHWDWVRGTGLQYDVLLPFFNHYYQEIITYPWQYKKPVALMRAAMQNGMHRNCTRMWLVALSKKPEGQRLLDVGITNNLKRGFKTPLVDPIPIPDHAKWKYLLSADGFAASCRFGKLLQTNSLVLKEESRQIEYYYRSVKPHVHYVPFTKDNVMEVLSSVEAMDDSKVHGIAEAAQHFAYRYLSQHAKAMYVRRAVQKYNGLFSGALEAFVGKLDASQLTLQAIRDALRKEVEGT